MEIVSTKTLDENNVEQTKFMKGGCVEIGLLVRNIAMTGKTATTAITIYDLLNVLVNSTQMENYNLPANSTELCFHCSLTSSARLSLLEFTSIRYQGIHFDNLSARYP